MRGSGEVFLGFGRFFEPLDMVLFDEGVYEEVFADFLDVFLCFFFWRGFVEREFDEGTFGDLQEVVVGVKSGEGFGDGFSLRVAEAFFW